MAFSEKLKKTIRGKANLRCCICESFGIDIHHIIPQAEGGPDTEENAAPLCSNCHRFHGNNPDMRKSIREAKSLWFRKVANLQKGLDFARVEERFDALESLIRRSTSERDTLTLGGTLAFIYDQNIAFKQVSHEVVLFWTEFAYGGNCGEPFDSIKKDFEYTFGRETVERTIAYIILEHPAIKVLSFTEPECASFLGHLQVAMTLLTSLHAEVYSRHKFDDGEGVVAFIRSDGQLAFTSTENAD